MFDRLANEQRCQKILDAAAPLRTDDLAWAEVARTPVAPEVVDCLVYMRDVEGFTDNYSVGLTAHPTTLGDPFIGRFLPIWRQEEAGHAAALDTFLGCYRAIGMPVPDRQVPPQAVTTALESVVSRFGGVVGDVVCAAHMAWGAANEMLAIAAYRILADRCQHPVLTELLSRIAAQEAAHCSFYLLQAQWRLTASRPARFLLPRVLAHSWTPVGVGNRYKAPADFQRVVDYLADGHAGRTIFDRMDRRFSSLPGFGDLRIFRRAVTTPALRAPLVV